jgi:hypothetical protein
MGRGRQGIKQVQVRRIPKSDAEEFTIRGPCAIHGILQDSNLHILSLELFHDHSLNLCQCEDVK